jgi:hypothetical protein
MYVSMSRVPIELSEGHNQDIPRSYLSRQREMFILDVVSKRFQANRLYPDTYAKEPEWIQ